MSCKIPAISKQVANVKTAILYGAFTSAASTFNASARGTVKTPHAYKIPIVKLMPMPANRICSGLLLIIASKLQRLRQSTRFVI